MRKALFTILALLLTLPANTFSQLPDSVYQKWLLTPEIKKGFDFALSAAKLTYQDFTLRTDYWEIDGTRMNQINSLMTDPLKLPYESSKIAIQTKNKNLPGLFEVLAGWGDLYFELESDTVDLYAPKMLRESQVQAGQAKNFPNESILNNADRLKINFFTLLTVLGQKRFPLKYNAIESDFIRNKLPLIILEDIASAGWSVDESDSAQKANDKLTQEFIPVATRFPHALGTGYEVEYLLRQINITLDSIKNLSNLISENKKPFFWEDKTFRAAIGGYGSNHYQGDYALIIDLGGDDTYELTRRPNFENQIIIDLGGDDKYFALEDYALACGYFGYSVLIDAAGDDLYQGKNFSLGCGFFGCGLLWDQAGSDTYIGDQFTQGAGGFGIGILKDDGGNDRYHSAYMAQGFGSVRGVGALLDATGSDNYFTGGKYIEGIGLSDEIRHLSMAQGCALGLRPDLSGGMGFLFDYEGDDSYSVDMNGQGSSYWWGLGALVDFKGNDRYVAQQYAQGAGIHMSLGVLVDSSGNDFYFSKGVAQGAGHDWGTGMLFDLYGNDTYVATDGSQAFGNSNGIGILADGAGDDGYYVKNPKNAQVYGDARREYGSIAIMFDCGGTDRYDGNGGENKIWKPTKITWGVGLDGEFGSADSAQVKK